ncbi:TolC family protein [Chryseolinea sp. T2]|uniref:TolC family protein n=1 Tax=Chryseolinea sp. T2 TaxID=3129255 RepID=UPI00307688DB
MKQSIRLNLHKTRRQQNATWTHIPGLPAHIRPVAFTGLFHICISLLLPAFVIFTPRQSSAQVVTLDEMFEAIASNNPQLKQYESRASAMDIYAAGAKSWMAPMVGVGTFMTPYPGQEVMEMDKGAVMFSLEQEIPNPGRQKAASAYMLSQSAIERTAGQRQLNTLRAEARMVYYRWLVAEKKRSVLDASLRTLDLTKKLAEVRYPYNKGSLSDIYKLEAKISSVQNNLTANEGNIDQARAQLLALMNLPINTSLMIDTTLDIHAHASGIDTAGFSARRSDLRELDARIASMELNRVAQQAQAKPDFKIRFDHMQPLGDNVPRQFTAMAMISIPIAPWSSRMYKAQSKGIRYEIQSMRDERAAVLTETWGKLAGMSKQLQSMEHHLMGYKQSIMPALEKNFQAAMQAYEENRGTLLTVLDGWEAMNMMQLEYFETMDEYYQMVTEYEKELEL